MGERRSGVPVTRRQFLAGMAAGLTLPVLAGRRPPQRPRFRNLVFVCVDDLNDWVSCLKGHPNASTPSIDEIAAAGTLFTDCHAAIPLCNPSRTATYFGMAPSTTGVYDNRQDWRLCENIDKSTSIFEWVKSQGVETYGMGKIFHKEWNRKPAWTWYWPAVGKPRPDEYFPPARFRNALEDPRGLVWDQIDDHEFSKYRLGDAAVRNRAMQTLLDKRFKETRYMLSVGFYRPHLPWIVPARFFDLFPREEVLEPFIYADDQDDLPPEALALAEGKGDEVRLREAGLSRAAVRAYLASVAYADHQVGEVFRTYRSVMRKKDTAFILWSDNGWHFGEKRAWRKRTLWREATRVPLIIVAPGLTQPGSVCQRPVSLSSLYATICDLLGFETPSHVESGSLLALLENPEAARSEPVVTSLEPGMHAVRTERWCYLRYPDGGEELYDRARDPREFQNLVATKDESFLNELRALLPQKAAAMNPLLPEGIEEDDDN